MDSSSPKLAILMLCCRDYEAVELALACHMAYGDPKVPLFALQNCRGDYDAERTLSALRRYEALYPHRIRVIEPEHPDHPYRAIAAAIQRDLSDYDYIVKVDDDVFPVAPGWLDALWQTWCASHERYGDKLAYVTPLINNNCWGFPEVLKAMGLEAAYFAEVARPHRVGHETAERAPRLETADKIDAGACGTIWNAPDIARWLHERSTLQPDRFIEATRGLGPTLIDNSLSYSIGCILSRRDLYEVIDDGRTDDEKMMFRHCREHDRRIVCARNVPFVHLAYFVQRDELRDIVRRARDVYEPRLALPHPVAAKASHLDEVESRLRFIEKKMAAAAVERPRVAPLPRIRFASLSELALEEEAARESDLWGKERLAGAVPLKKRFETLSHALGLARRGGLALEFGVGGGATLRVIADERGDGRVWGFDSFKGLPEAWRPGYPVGEFAQDPPVVPGANLVIGLFDRTLAPFLVEHTEPVDFVHIDCDLYSSTRVVLGSLQHRLRPGSVVLFDEYFHYPGWREHEHKAWTEFVERTGVKFSYEAFTVGDEQVAVRILQ